jgi:hypothetical protein
MENPNQFDLNGAIARWRDDLNQFQQFRVENVDELESHLRDSVETLRGSGLSEEEAFLIARSRLGRAERLETEFSRVEPRRTSKVIHGLVFLFFTTGCFFLWATLQLPRMMAFDGRPLPGFTVLCFNLRWVLYALVGIAAAYLAFVCLRKTTARLSWVGFFASSVAVLILIGLQISVAVLLPLIDFMSRAAR